LFADAGLDLLTINIADPTQAVLIDHHYNLFNHPVSTAGIPVPNLADMVLDVIPLGNTLLPYPTAAC